MRELNENEKSTIWIAKGIAAIAIVSCHCCWVNVNASAWNQVSYNFMFFWNWLGVPVFYFFAGFFYNNRVDFYAFWKKKINSIIVPWLFTGTIVWLYVVLRKGGMTFETWLQFVCLKQSYLYFLTDLIIFFAITWRVKKEKQLVIILSLLIIVSVLNGIFGINLLEELNKYVYLSNYAYFLLGKILSFHTQQKMHNRYGIVVISLWAILQFAGTQWSVVGCIGILIGGLGIVGIIYISSWLRESLIGNELEKWGRRSFSIYLLHMPFAGITANLLNRSEKLAFLTILRPIIVIIVTSCVIEGVIYCARKVKLLKYLIGCRE